jgi:glucan phosphoethanolaminetransferase (alkaline phosphatase superfamily)
MIRKLFLFHFILFLALGALLHASGSLTFKSFIVHEVYAISIFFGFFLVWRMIAQFRIKIAHYIWIFGYYNYLFLTYLLFELGKGNLGVPMTWKMIYPYLENYRLLGNLISTPKRIFTMVGYIFILGIVFYFWNKVYRYVHSREATRIQPRSLVLASIPAIILVLLFVIFYDDVNTKFNEHKLNEPYLTLLFFDEAFDRQKEPGDENRREFQQYTSPKGNGKNVVLIIADALRPDFFQSDEQLTPFVDSLLATSGYAAHKSMYATTSFSFNGISAILSSSDKLYEQNFFLHDVLKKQGYDIHFILSGDMTNFWGLKEHITTESVDFYTDGYESFQHGRSKNLNDDQKNILDQLVHLESFHGTPTFFYFHMMSVHQIGNLKEHYQRFQPSSIDLSSKDFDPQLLVNDYKNRMIQLDDYIRQLYKTLQQKGYLEDVVFVITADHGQSLGENGYYFHSKYINYESIHIPLIVNSSQIFNTTQIASQLDIAPSILEALELKIPKTWKGRSLSDSIPQTIFQTQGDFYSMIWKERDTTYQLYYDQKVDTFQLFDVSPISQEKNKDIISEWEASTLDSLKRVLKSKFQLNQIN